MSSNFDKTENDSEASHEEQLRSTVAEILDGRIADGTDKEWLQQWWALRVRTLLNELDSVIVPGRVSAGENLANATRALLLASSRFAGDYSEGPPESLGMAMALADLAVSAWELAEAGVSNDA